MLAKEHLHNIMKHCQQALNEIEQGNKRRTVGYLDEIEHAAESSKWLIINQVIEEEGEF